MRLGVVGLLPSDFRTVETRHLETIRALGLTGGAFHAGAETLVAVTPAELRRTRAVFAAATVDIVQFGVAYGECLFDPAAAVRERVLRTIARGVEVARELGAQVCLIRTGSLNPAGSYAPTRVNHTRESRARLVESLGRVARQAETAGQTVVVETHALTIMDSPETNREIIRAVGSARLRVVMDYVNHFQSLSQAYNSAARLDHIFDVMGAISAVAHCKDLSVADGFVVHLNEAVPGEGELDLGTAFRRWHQMYPDGYMLLEHLPNEKYALAARNAQRIAAAAGVPIH